MFWRWTISGVMSKHSGFPFTALIGACDINQDRNGDGTVPTCPSAIYGGIINKSIEAGLD